MKITAELNYLRMSPRKVRMVANAIRGKRLDQAERALGFLTRRASIPISKLLRSAAANAKHNFQISDTHALKISDIVVNEGPTFKRSRPRARGRAFPIRKRTSHIRLILESSGYVTQPRRSAPATFRVLAPEEHPGHADTATAAAERAALRIRPKVATKPTDFVRRIFRRKAI